MNTTNGNGHPPKLGVNQTYTKFFFVTLHDQPSAGTRIRQVGSAVARGFFNDFDADGQRDLHMFETIQFLLANRTQPCREGLLSATHVAQVSAKYRPRLDEVDAEFRRRLGNLGSVRTLDGAVRTPRYTSAEMDDFAYRRALGRSSGRETPNVIILPMSKTNEWWAMSALERQTYFYPHTDERSAGRRPRRGGGGRGLDDLPAPVPQSGRQPAPEGVRLHYVLRVRGRSRPDVRRDPPLTARRTSEPRVALRHRGA